MLCDSEFPGAEQGSNVPRKSWMDGVKRGLLMCRVVFFQSTFEEESRHAEMVVCGLCDELGIARMNAKKMDGRETKKATSDFVAIIEILRKGPLAPELQINQERLDQKGGVVSLAKIGNSSSAPYLIAQDVRLRKLHGWAPLATYIPYLKVLESHNATQHAGMTPSIPFRFHLMHMLITLTLIPL